MLSTASRPQTASNGGGGGNGSAGGNQYMQQQQPPPVIADSKELKKSKQKLKQTKASKAERRAKRAQSIDWTNADNHSSAAAATAAHAAANNMPVEPSMANHEDYYRDGLATLEESCSGVLLLQLIAYFKTRNERFQRLRSTRLQFL